MVRIFTARKLAKEILVYWHLPTRRLVKSGNKRHWGGHSFRAGYPAGHNWDLCLRWPLAVTCIMGCLAPSLTLDAISTIFRVGTTQSDQTLSSVLGGRGGSCFFENKRWPQETATGWRSPDTRKSSFQPFPSRERKQLERAYLARGFLTLGWRFVMLFGAWWLVSSSKHLVSMRGNPNYD